MPNLIDANGIQVSTRAELLAFFTSALQKIYGSDINLDSDSPDGQWVNTMIQAILDEQDLNVQTFNTFDPDNCFGRVLDQRCAINGVQRQAGTYTITNITLVNTGSVNLYGLDGATIIPDVRDDGNPIYTVSDNAGNLWLLQTTELGLSAGTHVLSFRAATPGAQLTTPNTITTQVTIIIDVSSVNNPTPYTTLGVNEESDAQLKIRRLKSVSLASQGYLAGLLAALENISGVTSAFVYENVTGTTNVDGVPGHSIWVIVAGNFANVDVATAIYDKRNAGCGMFGNTVYTIIQVDGSPFNIYWDTVVEENMFISFTATSINGSTAPNIDAIRTQLPSIFIPGVNESENINTLSTLVQSIDANTLVTNAGLSLAFTQILTLSGIAASGTFEILYNGNASAAINWNDSISIIQTKVQAVTGLSTALVTGSIASQTLTFNLTGIGITGVLGLITIVSNSLLTGGSVPITFAYNEGYTNTLTPTTKRNQLVVFSPNIVILPMILNPVTSSIITGNSQTYSALGGYGTYVYSISINNSGGTINSSSGLYTAGVTTSVVDTIKVIDAMGNTSLATVTVTA